MDSIKVCNILLLQNKAGDKQQAVEWQDTHSVASNNDGI